MSNQLPLPDRAASPERRVAPAHRRPSRRERGQALVLIAVAFVGLAAFIGLAVDAGILFTQIGHLRRAVDAAALGAANQFREGRTVAELTAAATEFINLNSVATGTAEVFICEEPFTPGGPYSPAHDPTLCPSAGDPFRKFVRVEGEVIVNFAFLPIIGFYSVPIRADAISETAAVDLVLVIDRSSSMAFELCSDGLNNDGDSTIDDCPSLDPSSTADGLEELDVGTCNNNRQQRILTGDAVTYPPENDCHPFEEVRAASQQLLSRMYFPYDRMAVVTFDRAASMEISLANGDDPLAVFNTINGLEVATNPFGPPPEAPCNPNEPGFIGDPRGCPNTNTSDGLNTGGNLFGDPNYDGIADPGEIRQEAVWILILLSDGAANALYDTSLGDPNLTRDAWRCPNETSPPAGAKNWIEPLCTDIDPSNTVSSTFGVGRHDFSLTPDLYDPDDAARDAADFVGCPDANSPQPAACSQPGQAAVIFAIGLGPQVTNTKCDAGVYGGPGTCGNLGEALLRYVAGAGDDGNPGTPPLQDPCDGVASGSDCGNYYFAPTGAGLLRVFEAIASRIFTRLTH